MRTIQTTMIGSLPHVQAETALKIFEEHPLTIPTWPQLPKRSFLEGMIPQYSEGFPGIKTDEECKGVWVERDDKLLDAMATAFEAIVSNNTDYWAISDKYAAGLFAFIEQLKKQGKKLPAVKGQVTGPFTFGLGLNDSDKKAVWFDQQYRDIIYKGLAAKAVWQVKLLQQVAEQVYLFFDEPIISALGTPAYIGIQDEDVKAGLNEVYTAARQAGAKTGTHCCGNMDWGLLAETKVNIIAFDAYAYGEKVGLYPEQIAQFLKRGGALAWGIVPTDNPELLQKETGASLKQKFDDLIAVYTNKGIPGNLLREQVILTPSCGIGSLPIENAGTVLQLLAEVKERI